MARNSLWLIAQPLLLNVLSIVSTGYIARKLGAADFGAFNLGFAQIALFTPLCSLGLRAVAVRAVAEDRANAAETVRAVFALRLLFTAGAALLALLWLALPTYSLTTRVIGLAAIVSMAAQSFGLVAVDMFRGLERARLAAQPQMIGGLLLTLLSVLALLAGLGLPGFVAAYVLGALIQLGLLHWTARRCFAALRPAWDWPRMREHLRQARPFALLHVLTGVMDAPVLDVLILGALFQSAVVGAYTAAIGLVGRLLMLPFGIADALYPAIAHRYGAGREEVEAVVRRCVLNLLLVTMPAALCLSVTAPTVLWILFGDQYAGAAGALRVAAWLLPLTGLSYLVRECLSAVHRQGVVVRLSLGSGGLLVALYAALIPAFGPVGAALAGVARELVMLPVWLHAASREFRRPAPLPELAKLALALGAMAVPFLPLAGGYTHWYAVLSAPLAAVCYGAAALALGLVQAPHQVFGCSAQAFRWVARRVWAAPR